LGSEETTSAVRTETSLDLLMLNERYKLRRDYILQRSLLSLWQQQQASKIICRRVMQTFFFLRSKRVAFYFANNGEVNAFSLLAKALSMGKACYLPVLHPVKHNQMWFGRYQPGDSLRKNSFGILEPILTATELIAPWSLDTVITPLVAFDDEGNRLGMGGGFYDRTFSFKKTNSHIKPRLVGLAYEFQHTTNLERQAWDISLDAVFTETNSYLFIP
jgi:5-formyltetrahydrofolate cyclo-ligase